MSLNAIFVEMVLINDIIKYETPKTLEEAMRKEIFFYEKNHKKESMANWKAKMNNKFEQKKKEFVPNRNSKNNNTINFLFSSLLLMFSDFHTQLCPLYDKVNN